MAKLRVARRAWIETSIQINIRRTKQKSRVARRAWIETARRLGCRSESSVARRAWIETYRDLRTGEIISRRASRDARGLKHIEP